MLEPKLVEFVRASIPSIWALELLLLMRRAAPQFLTHDELVHQLRATPKLIHRLVGGFVAAGLVEHKAPDLYRFQCATEEADSMCEALAAAADERPIALRDAIIAAPAGKLRDLADAFRFKDADDKKGDSGK